ncbi:MAG: hypothetical protein NTX79_08155 [Candidatus Micrarchaeota archaeon]|nr:hypothetical protein [Candidatus Micrarchaeota archaeon]
METGTGIASLPLRRDCELVRCAAAESSAPAGIGMRLSCWLAVKSLLALLLAASVAWADGTPPAYLGTNSTCGVESFGASGGGEAVSFIALSFALVSLCIALAYMYSKFHEDPAMGVWAKDEAFNLVISVFLFAGLLVFFSASCSLASGYSGGNPIYASQQYLDSLISSNGLNILKTLTSDSLTNQLDATKYRYLGLTPFWGEGAALRSNRKAYSSHEEYLIDMYLPIIASLTAQKYIITGIAWMGAYVLLPFAFVMRLIPPTRDFGNVLIALFFGLYIVVPTMYAMSGKVFMQDIANNRSPYTTDPSLEKFCSYGLDNSQPPCGPSSGTILYRIGSTIPQAVFLPNLVIIVAISCIMALSKALRAIAV